MSLTITPESPERGWPPFLDWLRSVDIDPYACRSVTIAGEGPIIFELVHKPLRRRLDHPDEIDTYTAIRTAPLPPLHPSRTSRQENTP